MHLNQFAVVALVSILVAIAEERQAVATISLVSGTGTAVANPNNHKYYADPYNITTVFYWSERSGVVLASNLVVSILPPGSYPTDSTSQSTDGSLTVPAGTVIDSYMLNFDPQSGSAVADFSFDKPIVGLITYSGTSAADDHLFLSDYLIDAAVPAANIPTGHYDARGIETTAGDFIHWVSPTEITISLGASSPGDQVRVITAQPVPEPATAAALLAGAAMMLWRRPATR